MPSNGPADSFPLLWLPTAWFAFALFHSFAASTRTKEWAAHRWPKAVPWYRLAYNVVSLVAVLPALYLTYATNGPLLWQWTGAWRWVSQGLALVAVGGFVVTARWYDMGVFLGLRQLREHDHRADGNERLHISPIHRFVRHPWYFFGLLLVWTGDKNLPLLVSALAVTLYLIVGARLEEGKLIATYGDSYRRYRTRVAGLVPLPWKTLSAEEAQRLTD